MGKAITVNGNDYTVSVGYWLQPYFRLLAKLNGVEINTVEEGDINGDEIKKVINRVLDKAIDGTWVSEDETQLFNNIIRIFKEDVEQTTNLGANTKTA